MVAENVESLAEAYVAQEKAWPRGVFYKDIPVGFVMLEIDGEKYYLWRFMIDRRFQGRGFGKRAMELVLEFVRSQNATEMTLSYVPGKGNPSGFYAQFGFEETGEVDDDELIMKLIL